MTIVEITGGMLRAARVPVDLSFEDLAGSRVDELTIRRVERERLRRACRRHHARQHHECRRRAGRLAMNVDARLRVSRGPDADARLRCDARECYGGLCQEGGASNEKKAPGVPGLSRKQVMNIGIKVCPKRPDSIPGTPQMAEALLGALEGSLRIFEKHRLYLLSYRDDRSDSAARRRLAARTSLAIGVLPRVEKLV